MPEYGFWNRPMKLDDKTFKSITFFSKRFTAKHVRMIQHHLEAAGQGLTRTELAKTVARQMKWMTPSGKPRFSACLSVLELLEQQGVITLPEKRQSRSQYNSRIVHHEWAIDGPPVHAKLSEIGPIRLEVVNHSPEDNRVWKATVDKHHYLGHRQGFGPQLKYAILDQQGRWLGCLMFESITKHLPCRDQWIGWTDAQRNKTRHLVVCNSRFLIFPWVSVRNLASHVLGRVARQLADDWDRVYHYRPVLIETFIDQTRFKAHSYKGAGWFCIGQTQYRKDKTRKEIYLRPLLEHCQSVLTQEPLHPSPANARLALREQLHQDPELLERWSKIIEATHRIARHYDGQWLQRRRTINTQLILLFVFRLVMSPERLGYRITLSELWEQCRNCGIELYQQHPVSNAAISKARDKLDAVAFKDLHHALLEHVGLADRRWLGHRVFAVDGTHMNLPKKLQQDRFVLPSPNASYPQGLVSCLYRLHDRVVCDFNLCAGKNERKSALAHLSFCQPGDLLVYDRGYYSRAMLGAHENRDIRVVFRVKKKANSQIKAFVDSADTDQQIVLAASHNDPQRTVRLVKCPGSDWVLLTTLLDANTYTPQKLADLYHQRWSIEEMYKQSKLILKVENFHAQNLNGVRQELYANFTLIVLARLMSQSVEKHVNGPGPVVRRGIWRTNGVHSLRVTYRSFEKIFLDHANSLSSTMSNALSYLAESMYRERLGRSYKRISQKPIGKWKPSKVK